MFLIPLILLGVIAITLAIIYNSSFKIVILILISSLLLNSIILSIDYFSQVLDTEIWSGEVVDWEHREEWDEWILPVTTCITDSNGKQSCKTTPGYWKHHYATNKIKTSDSGWINVEKSPYGKMFNDNWPNDKKVLIKYWPKGTPTASKHTYENKVNASYSVYKHKSIDVNDFPDLPKYPSNIRDKFYIDRIVGYVPNKEKSNEILSKQNTRLNKMIPDPDKKGKMRSWKQVNIIFVNVGENKPEEYGFALQDSWEGGNKNDFIVSFSMNKDGKLNWVYPFSWSEVEILKLEVRDYMMNKREIKDFVPVINDISKMIEDKFERKQFSDFSYLRIQPSTTSVILIWVINILLAIGSLFLLKK